ncbi:MAG TPA: hypothetical protein VGD84_25185 [Pseudonocardiaceae bacterium]
MATRTVTPGVSNGNIEITLGGSATAGATGQVVLSCVGQFSTTNLAIQAVQVTAIT